MTMTNLLTNEQIEGLEQSITTALGKQGFTLTEIKSHIKQFKSNSYNTINDVFVTVAMDFMPLMTRYAKRFERSSDGFLSADELVNATLLKVMTYDFETKWNDGKSKFMYETQYMYTTLFGELNNQARILYKDGKQGKAQKITEIKSFENLTFNKDFQFDEQGSILEYEYKIYPIQKVSATMGYLQITFDNKEILMDVKNLLSDVEFQAFRLYREGYKVREIASMIKDGRRAYDRMKKHVETYYASYCYEHNQAFYAISE